MLFTFSLLIILTILPTFHGTFSKGIGNLDYMDSGSKRDHPLHPENSVVSAIQENNIYFLLESYSQKLRIRLELIERFMKDYEESSLLGTEHIHNAPRKDMPFENFDKGSEVANHPFMAFRMVRRFGKSLPEIMANLDLHLEQDILQDIYSQKGNTPWPEVEDIDHYMEKIVNIQKVHDVPISEFADGRYHAGIEKPALPTEPSPVGLNPEQCSEMGDYAFRKGLIALAIEWMTVADSRLNDYEGDNELSKQRWRIRDFLEQYAAIHDDLWDMDFMAVSRGEGGPTHRNYGLYENKINSKVELIKRDTVDFKLLRGQLTEENAWVNFKALCKGENYQNERLVKPLLFCYYERKKHSYLKISPMKMEMLNKRPSVIQIHDFINGAESSLMFQFQGQSVLRKKIGVLKRIEYVTGLSTRSTKFGFSSKGIGQLDALENDDKQTTLGGAFKIHLSKPLSGGEIAFPMLGFVAKPEAGSAVFWNNFQRNGDKVKMLISGRCPVLQGFLTELHLEADGA